MTTHEHLGRNAEHYDPPEATVYKESTDKYWAMYLKPDFVNEVIDKQKLKDENSRKDILRRCFIGLAPNEELAKARLLESTLNPRYSNELIYDRSIIGQSDSGNSLTMLIYLPKSKNQKPEWLIECFVNDNLLPNVYTIPLEQHPDEFAQVEIYPLIEIVDKIFSQ